MIIKSIKTRVFKENEDLFSFILEYVNKPKEGSVLVITSKIVALAEGRTVVVKSKKEKERLIQSESEFAIKTKYAWLTVRDGIVMASAGIDESNANGRAILFPNDCFVSARDLHKKISKYFGLKHFGILITDSRLMPLRSGTVGMGMGYFGFRGIKSYVGKPDIFGRKLKVQRVNMVDSLACSAVLCMGEGREQKPIAIISDLEDTGIVFEAKKVSNKDLAINTKDDIYGSFFTQLKKKK